MRTFAALCLIAALGAGCQTTPETPAPADTAAAAAPGMDTEDGATASGTTFEITSGDDMRFSLDAFSVAPGDSITLTLRNTGNLPRETFGHNVVVLQKSADVAAFLADAAGAKATDFVPAARAAEVVAQTRLLGAGESDTITFVAPMEAGAYPFVCSFPGHGSMMKGTMTVQDAAL